MIRLFENAGKEEVYTSFGEGEVLEDEQVEFPEENSEACRNLQLSQPVLDWELKDVKHTKAYFSNRYNSFGTFFTKVLIDEISQLLEIPFSARRVLVYIVGRSWVNTGRTMKICMLIIIFLYGSKMFKRLTKLLSHLQGSFGILQACAGN